MDILDEVYKICMVYPEEVINIEKTEELTAALLMVGGRRDHDGDIEVFMPEGRARWLFILTTPNERGNRDNASLTVGDLRRSVFMEYYRHITKGDKA